MTILNDTYSVSIFINERFIMEMMFTHVQGDNSKITFEYVRDYVFKNPVVLKELSGKQIKGETYTGSFYLIETAE